MAVSIGKKIRRLFHKPLSEEETLSFHEDAVRSSKLALYIILVLISIFELVNILNVAFFTRLSIFGPRNRVYFTLYVFLFLVSVGCGLILLVRERSPERLIGIGKLYAVCCCLWSTGITAMDLRVNPTSISVYTITIVGVAVFSFLKPWEAAGILGGNHILFLCFYLFDGMPNNTGVIINTTVIALVSICISVTHYHGKLVQYESKRKVVRQNERMTQMLEQLNRLVMLDTLTNCYNRRFLDEVLPEKWRENQEEGRTVAAVMVDIDDFKLYNDRYGHQAGDLCLKEIAELMKRIACGVDDYLIRYGGEEFTLILFGRTEGETLSLAEQVKKEARAFRLETGNGEAGAVTVSEGVCFYRNARGVAIESVIRLADEALYEAKRQGKNRVIHVHGSLASQS